MRLLFVLAYYDPYVGGAEYVFKRLTEGLARRGHCVRVITSHLPGTPYRERIDGVDVERVPVPRFGDRYFFSLLNIPQVARRARDYDLIHTASNNIAPPVHLAGKLFGKPVVFTCHELLGKRWKLVEPQALKAWLFRNIEKAIVTRPYERHVAVSHATYADLMRAGVEPRRTSVIYNGVDELFSAGQRADGKLRAMCGLSRDDFLYVYFGRPGATKGVDYLLQAAPAIQKQVPHAHLALILAKEPFNQYARLRRMIDELGPGAQVHLVPPTPDREQLVRYLLDADCIVIPSLTEGFGLTTAEACTLGVPVVATRVGAIPEVVSGKHILVDPGSARALAAGVARAARGQYDDWKAPQQFSWARMVAEYEEMYKELLR
jgi:glycosyltransferase involved in cell wall biosynthesis